MEFKEFVGKFIGPNRITAVSASERVTYLKRPILKVEYANGEAEEYPAAILKNIVTDAASDLTKLRDAYVKPVIEEVISILLEAEVSIADIEQILARTSMSLNDSLERANAILWGKDLMKRTVADIHKILLEAHGSQPTAKKGNDGSQRKRGKPDNKAKK